MASTTKKKKNTSKVFVLGVFTGVLLFWGFFDQPFKTFTFQSQPWKQPTTLLQGAFPIPTTNPIVEHKGYSVAYDGRTRTPLWVYRKLTSEHSVKTGNREICTFKEDPLIPAQIRSTPRDYEGSGYDRGHLSPAADQAVSQESIQESFYLSNIAPQLPEFNRGVWKRLENQIRGLLEDYPTLHVFAGPLYLPHKSHGKRFVKYEVIGKNDVAVPTHFFALIFIEQDEELLSKGYILPNKGISSEVSLEEFDASVEAIERLSGIVFSQMMDR